MTVINPSVKLYADECFSGFVVEDLRRLGYDVLTVKENGKANQSISDVQVLKDAIFHFWDVPSLPSIEKISENSIQNTAKINFYTTVLLPALSPKCKGLLKKYTPQYKQTCRLQTK